MIEDIRFIDMRDKTDADLCMFLKKRERTKCLNY
jgi:hypothetical protein